MGNKNTRTTTATTVVTPAAPTTMQKHTPATPAPAMNLLETEISGSYILLSPMPSLAAFTVLHNYFKSCIGPLTIATTQSGEYHFRQEGLLETREFSFRIGIPFQEQFYGCTVESLMMRLGNNGLIQTIKLEGKQLFLVREFNLCFPPILYYPDKRQMRVTFVENEISWPQSLVWKCDNVLITVDNTPSIARMKTNISGHFRLHARLPEGPMELHPYFLSYFGDITITATTEPDQYRFQILGRTGRKEYTFRLGVPFDEEFNGSLVKSTIIAAGDTMLAQTTTTADGKQLIILRQFADGFLEILYQPGKQQVKVVFIEDGIQSKYCLILKCK